MKIPGLDLDGLFSDLDKRGDRMQESLDDIRDLLVKIEENTRPSSSPPPPHYQLLGPQSILLCDSEPLTDPLTDED